MATVKYLTPYVITPQANDIKSGKAVSNRCYYRSGLQGASPPAYGAPVVGSSSTATLLTNFATAWGGILASVLSVNYVLRGYELKQITGWGYKTPVVPISALIAAGVSVITTGPPHGLTSGQVVNVQSVSSPAGVNGLWVATVTSPTSFEITTPGLSGPWLGGGQVQLVDGQVQLRYGDIDFLVASTTGSRTGEAVPLFSDASVDRKTNSAGKNFRSRVSMAPIAESDQENGRFGTTRLAVINAAVNTFFTTDIQNGGSDTGGSANMVNSAFSSKLAFTQATPFVTAAPFMATVTSAFCQPNLGSNLKRKPKLTSVIT